MGQPFVKYITDYLKEKLYHNLSSRGKKTLRTFDKNLEDEKMKDLQQAQEREREERKEKKKKNIGNGKGNLRLVFWALR